MKNYQRNFRNRRKFRRQLGYWSNPDWPLYDGEAVNSLILIEAIAQTAAIVEGHKRKQRGRIRCLKDGLVGIKNAEFYVEKIPVNTNLIIMLESKYSFDNYGVVEGTVKAGKKNSSDSHSSGPAPE